MNKNWTATNDDSCIKSSGSVTHDYFEYVAQRLPDGYMITICIERGAKWVKWKSPDGYQHFIDEENDNMMAAFMLAYQRCVDHRGQ